MENPLNFTQTQLIASSGSQAVPRCAPETCPRRLCMGLARGQVCKQLLGHLESGAPTQPVGISVGLSEWRHHPLSRRLGFLSSGGWHDTPGSREPQPGQHGWYRCCRTKAGTSRQREDVALTFPPSPWTNPGTRPDTACSGQSWQTAAGCRWSPGGETTSRAARDPGGQPPALLAATPSRPPSLPGERLHSLGDTPAGGIPSRE